MTTIEWIETSALTPNRRNARTHSTKQIAQIAESIKTFGFLVPIVVDEPRNIIAGHGRFAAARKLGLDKVPVIAVSGLSPAKKRALALADNKIAENAGWDREILAVELPELSELLVADKLDISITGFATAEIDQIIVDFESDTDGARRPVKRQDMQRLDAGEQLLELVRPRVRLSDAVPSLERDDPPQPHRVGRRAGRRRRDRPPAPFVARCSLHDLQRPHVVPVGDADRGETRAERLEEEGDDRLGDLGG